MSWPEAFLGAVALVVFGAVAVVVVWKALK